MRFVPHDVMRGRSRSRPAASYFRTPGNFAQITAVFLLVSQGLFAATNLSTWVYPGPSGRILQRPDGLGNRVLDYTSVGYKGGTVPLPAVPVKATVSPVAGDDTANIQAAINTVKALPLDPNGFRGAVLLTAGEYQLSGSLTINASGVVLRGAGSGTNGTVLRATATNQYSLIKITGSGSASSSTTHNITNNYVPVGATSFLVDSPSGFAVGDRVFVRRIATANWITELGMDQLCCEPDVSIWTPSGYHIDMDRIITRIEGNRIFINAPITTAIEARYAGGTIRKYTWTSRITNCGVENLRGVSDYTAADDENHGWILVQINSTENVWVRDVTSQYFGYACVALYGGTRFATVRDCRSYDPVSIITGGRRYAFVMDDCTFCLVQNCYTDEDRHQFVTQSLTTGPNVFVDGLSDTAKSDAGPHHRWASGALWDNITVNGNALNIQNRGNLGSGHGWSGANMVAYNCYASSGYVVQKPPGAHNWLIGSVGSIKNGTVYVGPHDAGDYDSSGSGATNVFPSSLYYAQLQDRLAAPNLQTREYWMGEINQFTNSTAPGETVPVDSAWQSAITSAAGGAAVNGFDVIANNQWVPFTFNFSLSATDQIVAATLTVSLRAASGAAADDVLYLDSITNAFTLASLGWTPVSTSTNPTVKVLDLLGQLDLLADGKLNVALKNDVGIDWALLQLQVAPVLPGGTNIYYPVADATVRGGANANLNFGTAPTLTVKEDTSNDNDRKAVLRWDLSSVTGTVYQARIRLTPVSVGMDGIEQGLAFATNSSWSETAVTWNNQPFAGKRFATWIPGTNGPVEVAVTPQVMEALAGDRQLAVQLYSIRNFGANGGVDYASREAVDVNMRPQLRLFMAGAAPGISDLTNRTTGVGVSTGPISFTVGDTATPATELILSGGSSNPGLVPNANIVFGGGGSNRTVTVAPAANLSGAAVITITVTDGDGLSASAAFTLTVGNHAPGVIIWNGPGSGANNWSADGNWNPAGAPEAFDEVKFFDIGAGGVAVSNVNNLVDATFGGTIASLQFGNTNGNHTMLIPAGKTLNVVGATGLTVGTETDNGNAQAVNTTVTGPGGALTLNGGNLVVRQASDSSGGARATLDLSGLDEFRAELGRVLIGTEGVYARPAGTLQLARTNVIVASGGAPAIAIGGAGGGSGNAGSVSHLLLGKANVISASTITVGRVKQGTSSGLVSSLRFNPAFTNANPLFGPTATLRASDGMNRVTTWAIADSQSQGGTVNTAGTCDFTGGAVDALVDTLIVGRSSTGSGAGNPVGTLALHAGTMDVNTLQIGVQGSASANSGNNIATGTVNVNGGLLRVNTALQLGPTAGGGGASGTRGVFVINGGTAWINAIACGAGTNNTLTINNGTLSLTNGVGAGLNVLALTNATLQLRLGAGAAALAATNVATGGGNTIQITALPVTSVYPTNFTVLKYGSLAGAGFNFSLGSLPASAGCGGYLTNNLASGSVDLVVTNCIVSDAFLTWNGDVSGSWDAITPNWKNNLTPGLNYAPGSVVVFNDSASGETEVTLATTLAPASLVVSNNTKAYTFGGLGGLSGAMALTKRGGGNLILANGGENDFTGGVFIESGLLQVGAGGGDGSLPGGAISNDAVLVFNLSDDAVAANVIAGSGAVVQNGPNELTLSGANTFAGIVRVNRGTLKAGSAAALGTTNGATVVTNGGSLNVNGLSLGGEPLIVSGAGETNGGVIVNHGAQVTTALRNITLGGDATFGGTGRWDIRNSGGAASLLTGGQPFKITKTGTNQVSLVGVNPIDAALGDIDIQQGVFAIQTSTTQLGDPNRTLLVRSNATLNLWALSGVPLNKKIVVEDGGTIWNESGSSFIVGPVTLTNGMATMNVGGAALTFSNTVISGAGGITKTGAGTLNLHGLNTYTGSTLVSTGTLALVGSGFIAKTTNLTVAAGAILDVSGRSDGRLTLANGQTLFGDGMITGHLTVSPGAILSPGAAIGALTVTNSVALQGVTFMELNKGAATNDLLRGATSIAYGGTLQLTNNAGALALGDAFKLFSASAYSGAFNSLMPPTPGSGLAWNTSTLTTDGTLRVSMAPRPVITIFAMAGGELVLGVTNGIPNAQFHVLTATNIALPLSQWDRLATNVFSGAGSSVFSNTPSGEMRFYTIQLP